MSGAETNTQTIRSFLQAVWGDRDLAALPQFWAEECVNHAAPGPDNVGLDVLRAYHAQFFAAFDAFTDVRLEIVQQVSDAERVVTHLVAHGRHSGPFLGLAPTGRMVSLAPIRIDRFQDHRIAEHWSVADMAGLQQQVQP